MVAQQLWQVGCVDGGANVVAGLYGKYDGWGVEEMKPGGQFCRCGGWGNMARWTFISGKIDSLYVWLYRMAP